MTTKNSDNFTLKNITGKPGPLYVFAAGKPQIEAIPRSDVLQRIHGFLPRMEEANKDLPNIPTMNFEVINCTESSSEDSDTSSDEDDGIVEAELEAQDVDEVPLAFREVTEALEESSKKRRIEVLND